MHPLLTLCLVAIAVVFLATAAHPVPIGTVTSDSMSPTLERGDTFVALPPALIGAPSPGDIVVFRSDGGWTTHRVVASDGDGLSTAGDANAMTDQQVGDPPVAPADVVGVIPTVDDRPVAIKLPLPDIDPRVLGVIGAILLVVALPRTRRDTRGESAAMTVGGLTAIIVFLVWVLEVSSAQPTAMSVANVGPLPMVALSPSDELARLLWPGSTVEGPISQLQLVPGWAPETLLEVAITIDPAVAVACIALASGIVVGTLSTVLARL